MSLQCPKCGTEFDVTLFSFDRAILCDCGEWVSMSTGHTQQPDRQCRHQVAPPVTGDGKIKLKRTAPPVIESISAVSLATHDMVRAVKFYQMLGFNVRHGGANASFTSMDAGSSFVNLIARSSNQRWSWWGRVIFYVSDVDAMYRRVVENGLHPDTSPRDAEWGERFFHITDPDGHELSFAAPLPDGG